jgi:hypothetical protein
LRSQCNFDFHARIGVVAEHFDQTAYRLRMLARLFDQFNHHHLSRLHLERLLCALLGRCQQYVLADALVLGDHEAHAVLLDDAPDHVLVGTFGDFDDLAFRTPLAIDADHPCDGLVAV